MGLHHKAVKGLFVATLGLVIGCSNDVAAPANTDDELVVTLEGLAQEANQAGDPDAGAAYSAAAMAARLGIRPTPIPVVVGDVVERYRAFVHVVTHARPNGAAPIRLRTMVAVHGEGRPDAVLYVATVLDSAGLVHPTLSLDRRMDVRQMAWAAWKDLTNRQIWVATSGKAGIGEIARAGECPAVSDRATVQCFAATFSVFLDGQFQPLVDNRRDRIEPDRRLGIATRAEEVNGAILVF